MAIWWLWARMLSCMGIIRSPEVIFFQYLMFSIPLWCRVLMTCVKGEATALVFQESVTTTHAPPRLHQLRPKSLTVSSSISQWVFFPHSHTHTRSQVHFLLIWTQLQVSYKRVSAIRICKSKEFNRVVQQHISLSWMPSERDHEKRNPQAIICLRLHTCPSCALDAVF